MKNSLKLRNWFMFIRLYNKKNSPIYDFNNYKAY